MFPHTMTTTKHAPMTTTTRHAPMPTTANAATMPTTKRAPMPITATAATMPPGAKIKPVSALYVVYMLRSIARPGCTYIGSTPNPGRRVRQHNGEIKGGAARTSRGDKRPWEMVAVVAGFPGAVAALKFEWALAHPHITSHIALEERIKGGSRRGRPSFTSATLASTLYLLLCAPAFTRWPLEMRFFARDLHDAWVARTRNLAGRQRLRADLPVLTDFGPEGAAEAALAAALASQKPPASQRKKKKTPAAENDAEETPSTAPPPSASQHRRTKADQPTWGVHALPTDYAPLKEYIAKAHGLLSDGRRHPCVLCLRGIASGQGVYAVCPATGCKAVGHLTCWSRHLLKQEKKAARSSESSELEHIVPLAGRCKACAGRVEWGLMMKELTLRTRDEKAVYAMLYPKRRGRRKDGEEEEEEERIEEGEEEEEDELEEDEGFGNDPDDDGDEGDV